MQNNVLFRFIACRILKLVLKNEESNVGFRSLYNHAMIPIIIYCYRFDRLSVRHLDHSGGLAV